MKLKSQKRIAGIVSKRSPKKVKFDPESLEEIKESITKLDIRNLIKSGAIKVKPIKGVSRSRARKTSEQKKKGRRKGAGSRKGKAGARTNKKRSWINKIRKQREFLQMLKEKDKITKKVYRELYLKSKGGFFRSKRHLQLYINEHELIKK